uniref:Uncharacterized protein n=1 Tax=Timema poppense TaxID=170557 RepID=A0A7R9H9D1_TIMPO|nr:unnamed protein product [Timema poppensis]
MLNVTTCSTRPTPPDDQTLAAQAARARIVTPLTSVYCRETFLATSFKPIVTPPDDRLRPRQLEEKEAQLARTEADAERRLTAEQRLTAELRASLQSREEEGERLRRDVAQLNDRLRALARQHEGTNLLTRALHCIGCSRHKTALDLEGSLVSGTLLHEHSLSQELLSKCEREWEARTTKLQRENKVLTERLEESERVKGELGAQLALERAQRQEEVALATQQTRAREAGKLVQLEERVSSLREEKQLLETQLAQSNSNVTQLQQQNSSLVTELAEPQRRLAQLHEVCGGIAWREGGNNVAYNPVCALSTPRGLWRHCLERGWKQRSIQPCVHVVRTGSPDEEGVIC